METEIDNLLRWFWTGDLFRIWGKSGGTIIFWRLPLFWSICGSGAGIGRLSTFHPQNSVFFHFYRLFSPIVCAVFLLFTGWSSSAIYAQLDAKSPQNWAGREARNVQPANPAAVMMREMQASLKTLPWDELSPAVQKKIKSVTSGTPLFHRMPQQTIYADPEIYHFLLRHPELITGFWEHLGAAHLSLYEIKADQYIFKETIGTTAVVEVLHRTNDLCIAYAKGEYRGPLMSKSYQGDVILVLRTQFARDEMNEPMVVCNLDTFVQINSLGADVLAKLFFAALTKVMDSNFEVSMSFVSQVSSAAAYNAAALKSTTEEISSIRQSICVEFCEVVDRAAMRFVRRNQPMSLAASQQRTPLSGLPETNPRDFVLSVKPPADWEMDHFVDSPQLPYTTVRYERTGELNVPKPLEGSVEYAVPKLPVKSHGRSL